MSDETPNYYPMCCVCVEKGGYAIRPGGTWYPPERSCAPYSEAAWFTDVDGKRTHQGWPYDPMCPVHAHELVERVWRAARDKRAKRSQSGMEPVGSP